MLIKQWDEVLSASETNGFVRGLANLFARRITDSEVRASLLGFIANDDFRSLCDYQQHYTETNALDVYNIAQVIALFSKRADLDIGVDKASAARVKFAESEARCRDTNALFRLWSAGKVSFLPGVERVLFLAQRKIAQVLGDVPDMSQLRPRFGPGSTTQVQKRTASARNKLGQTFCCSEELAGYVDQYLCELPRWAGLTEDGPDEVEIPVVIHNGRLEFVPKTAKTDRSIVVEPMLNSFFQCGIGDFIAHRLKTVGVDIRDQSRNQKLAREASVDGGLATLDLSSASDSIAIELVAHLLPIDWFLFLSQFRTGTVEDGDQTMRLQKFSSMGNGFTFPLETLIFWALAQASASDQSGATVSVYGDDIIVPVGSVPLLHSALTCCGFILNMDKSFWSGPFRESCGKDYYSGILVRPVFLKDRVMGSDSFILHNFFVRVGDYEAAEHVLTYISPEIRIFGPDGYGDGHLLGDSELTPYRDHVREKDPHSQWCGKIFDTFTWKGRKSFRPTPGDYVYPCYTAYLHERQFLDDRSERELKILTRIGRKAFSRIFGEGRLGSLLQSFSDLSVDVIPYKGGSFGVSLPGVAGFKRISIYTLST